MNDWQKIGEIGVDAGLCWIGDPCYILDNEGGMEEIFGPSIKNWSDFCGAILEEFPTKQQFNFHPAGHAGLGVCVSTGYGDGRYDVLAKIKDCGNWGSRVTEVKVVFIPEDEQ